MRKKNTMPLKENNAYSTVISEDEKNTESIFYQAKYDYLTNTLNRRSFVSMLEELFLQSKIDNTMHACLVLDLNKFKHVNDRYGHNIGDKLLRAVSERIKALLHKDDILARMSGDEFSIILKYIDRDSEDGLKRINQMTAKLGSELARPFIINQNEIITGASIGVRIFPDDAKSASDVMIHADVAMYRSKKKKIGHTSIYDKQTAQEHRASNLLKKELEKAYTNDEFVFLFQPKVDVKTNRIKGVETLVRWNHPTRGMLMPSDFFKEAYKIGMVSKITELSIISSCELIASTQDFYQGTVAINVNSREISDTFFISRLVATLEEYDIDPRRIELEITEEEIIKNFDLANIHIKKLKKLGMSVSIDDFGTGYSSITYLHKLSVDTMKMDKSFMKHSYTKEESDKDWILVQAIAHMAKAFQIKILAEGVENETQLSMVKTLGIDEYQGFLFSKAVDREQLLTLLQQ